MKNSSKILFLLLFVSCCKPEVKKGDTLFSLLQPSSTNVDFKNNLAENEQFNIIEYLYFNNGAGVAAGDINNDGLIDLYFTSNQESNKLYLNKGNLRFEDITDAAGVAGKGTWKTGVTMADVNGDGLLDIYVCQVGNYKSFKGRNQLFINQGNLTFKDEAREYGLDFQGFSTQAAFFDFDLDGDLDMYLLNHSVHTSRSYGYSSLRFDQDTLAGDRLFRHEVENGKDKFIDITRQAGIFSSQIGYGLGVNISDINNDGYPDIFVSNDFHENDYLYINNRNGTFSERMTEFFAHTSRSSMGNDIGDINNDGMLDVIVLDMLPFEEKIRKHSGGEDDYELSEIKLNYGYYYQFVRNTLQLNLGGNLFSEIGLLAGVFSTDWSWSPLFCDLDNDGWKDLFITNGIYRRANDLDYVKFLTGGNRVSPARDNSKLSDKELYEKMPLYPNVNFIFRNNHNLTFSNVAKEWGLDIKSYSNGATYADLDNDGDLDLIANNINDHAFICRNNAENQLSNHFLSITFKGSGFNTRGIGARVTLYSGGQEQIAELFPTRGFMSSTSDVLHFGLGSERVIDSLIVRWPDLSEQKLTGVPADTLLIMECINARMPLRRNDQVREEKKMFSPALIPGLEFRHKEDDYVDFNRERLIPHSITAEGPALAVGDVNGDGLQDLFAGGAKGQASILFIQQSDGSFKKSDVSVFLKENFTDDVDAVFFDADSDGDKDLYIVHGGNELSVGNPFLTDILLINDGKGVFTRGELPLISHNGSCVRPCDFDNDGDVDLFVGSRSVPGAYGWSPDQFLLENDGKGHYRNITDSNAKGLKNIGMVTDADWIDFDNDGDHDLVIVGEWMKVCVFRNDSGHFTDVTKSCGLDETSGWWNCIHIADVDLDGDEDMIAGNLGLNSILKASVKEPVEMFLNDFDNNGSLDQVICSYQDGKSYPVASLDDLESKITGIDKKYPAYSDFGGKTVTEIFGETLLAQSLVKNSVLFESCLFINNGNGTFETKKLPVMAQFSPVRDIMAGDFNQDGNIDLILAGNDYEVRPSYGRYDASYGWCLLSDTTRNFRTLMPIESGLKITGDARRIIPIEIAGKKYLVAAVNNGELQVFQIMSYK